MSGHYHKPQVRMYGGKPLVYTGSAYQLTWGESGEDKYVYILDTKTLKYTSIKNELSPRFEFIRDISDYSKASNNYISVEIENPEDFTTTVSKFKGIGARDVRTTFKAVTRVSSISEDNEEIEQTEANRTPIEDAIDEYVNDLVEITDDDKKYVADQLKTFYHQSV
jgi:DNA repair exonuclease SbcCD nuclease subunit